MFCKRCYSRHHNEYVLHVLKPSRVKGHQEPPEYVHCNVCQLMSRIPGSGALKLGSHSGSVQGVISGPEAGVRKEPKSRLQLAHKTGGAFYLALHKTKLEQL